MIWSRERARRTKGVRAKNGFQLNMVFERDFAFDLDMRRIVAYVSLGLARHFREQLLRGKRPDDFGDQVDVKPRTRELGPRSSDTAFDRTGHAAARWYLGPIRGGHFSATRLLKPYGGSDGPKPPIKGGEPGRDFLLNILIKRGIDFQSVRGAAKAVIQRLFDGAVAASVGDVTAPEKFEGREGLLLTFQGDQ